MRWIVAGATVIFLNRAMTIEEKRLGCIEIALSFLPSLCPRDVLGCWRIGVEASFAFAGAFRMHVVTIGETLERRALNWLAFAAPRVRPGHVSGSFSEIK